MGAISTSVNFANNQVVTSTNLNDIIAGSKMDSDAVTGNTLNVSGGKMFVNALGITSNELGTSSVTTSKINDGAVTTVKLPDNVITTAKITDDSVTFPKISTSSVASKSEMETREASKLVSADQTKNDPGVAKAFASFSIATVANGAERTIITSDNIASVTRIVSGETQVNFTSGMSGDYVTICQMTNSGVAAPGDTTNNPTAYDKTASGFKVSHSSDSSARQIDFVVYGKLA